MDNTKIFQMICNMGSIRLIRDLKKLWIMEATVIPIITGSLGTILKNLEERIEELEIWVSVE